MSVTPPRIEVRAAPVDPVVVEGGPLRVIVELRVVTTAVRAQVASVLIPRLRSLGGVGVVARSNGAPLATVLPAAPDPEWSPVRDLDSGEARRGVVDLSPLVGGAGSGELSLRVVVATPLGRSASEELSLVVAPPNGPVAEALQAAREELEPGQTWLDWVEQSPESALDRRPLAELGPLALHALLRRWRRGPLRVAPEELDALGPKLSPERLGFLAERAVAAGDRGELARRMAETLAVEPGLGWWMEDLRRGRTTWTGANHRHP